MNPVASSMRAVAWDNPLLMLKKETSSSNEVMPQEVQNDPNKLLTVDTGDTVAISAEGLRASVEFIEQHTTELPEGVPTLSGEQPEKKAFVGALHTGVSSENGEAKKEYGGIPFVHSELGGYTGGTSEVQTGNIDNRSEQLKAMMNGMQAMQDLQLDQSKALMDPTGTGMIGSGVQEDLAGDMGKSENSQTMGNTEQDAAPGEQTDTVAGDAEEGAVDEYTGMPYVQSNLGSYGGGTSLISTDTSVGQSDSVYIKALIEARRNERKTDLEKEQEVMGSAAEELDKEKEEKEAELQDAVLAVPAPGDGIQRITDEPPARASAQQQQIRSAYQRFGASQDGLL